MEHPACSACLRAHGTLAPPLSGTRLNRSQVTGGWCGANGKLSVRNAASLVMPGFCVAVALDLRSRPAFPGSELGGNLAQRRGCLVSPGPGIHRHEGLVLGAGPRRRHADIVEH